MTLRFTQRQSIQAMVNPPHIDIDRLSEPELIDLNRRIFERLKMIAALRSHKAMLNFSVGQRVQFEPPGRGVQEGVIVRYNQKTVTLVTSSGEQWRVAPALLRPAGDIIDMPPSGHIAP